MRLMHICRREIQTAQERHDCPIDVYQTTAQTLAPTFTAGKGLEISLDQVDNESVEYVFGGNDALNPFRYVAGDVTDEDNGRDGVIFEATFEITDASGLDQFLIGWRSVFSKILGLELSATF
jgi:hypothetical protein